MKKFGKKVGMLPGDHEYAKDWSRQFAPVWEKAGGTIVSNNPMSYNRSADFYSGVSTDAGLAKQYASMRTMRLADGPDKVHNRTIARLEYGRYALAPPRAKG